MENIKTIEKKSSVESTAVFVARDIREALDIMPENMRGREREYLSNILNEKYHPDITNAILKNFSNKFLSFLINESKGRLLNKEAKKISLSLKEVPKEEQQDILNKILKEEYNIPAGSIKLEKTGWKISHKAKRVAGVVGLSLLPFLVAILGQDLLNETAEKKIDSKEPIKKENPPPVAKETQTPAPYRLVDKIKPIPEDESLTGKIKHAPKKIGDRFKKEIFDELPPDGKKVYEYFAKFNPTPGRPYMVLDKKTAKFYEFDENNNLIKIDTAGYGSVLGDENNSKDNPKKYTTPAGIYILDNFATPSDIKLYGELQFSLIGISVLGDNVFLGMHLTLPSPKKEFTERSKKLKTPAPEDNIFSNGCINIEKGSMAEIVKKFKGDRSELLVVLPDNKSTASFNIDELMGKIMEKIYKNAQIEESAALQEISRLKTTLDNPREKGKKEEIGQLLVKAEQNLLNIQTKRKAAEKILAQ